MNTFKNGLFSWCQAMMARSEQMSKILSKYTDCETHMYKLKKAKYVNAGEIVFADMKSNKAIPHYVNEVIKQECELNEIILDLSSLSLDFNRKYYEDEYLWVAIKRTDPIRFNDPRLAEAHDKERYCPLYIYGDELKDEDIIIGNEEAKFWDEPKFAFQLDNRIDYMIYRIAIPNYNFDAKRESIISRSNKRRQDKARKAKYYNGFKKYINPKDIKAGSIIEMEMELDEYSQIPRDSMDGDGDPCWHPQTISYLMEVDAIYRATKSDSNIKFNILCRTSGGRGECLQMRDDLLCVIPPSLSDTLENL